MNKFIVSISGSDNSGKSTQLKMLHTKYPNIFSKPLHITQSPSYPKNVDPLAFSKWWFTKENARDMVTLMIKSMKERNEYALNDCKCPIILYDRDDASYENKTLSALLVMNFSFDEANKLINEVKAELNYNNYNIEDLRIYIKTSNKHCKIKDDENKNSYNPSLYARHMVTTSVLDKYTLKNNNYTFVQYVDGEIDLINDQIFNIIMKNAKNQVKLEKDENEPIQ